MMWWKLKASFSTTWHSRFRARARRTSSPYIWRAKHIDEAKAYVNTMDAKELWKYFTETEHYQLKDGRALEGFMPDWIGEFYAYYQWFYAIPSAEVIAKVPLDFLKKAYFGLHDLDLELAVRKVGEE